MTKTTNLLNGVRRQKAIVEYKDPWSGGPEWWLMTEDGDVSPYDTADAAMHAIQKRAKRGNRTATVTTIEWRNTPEGWVPPKGDV